jgi:uncharacterized protein YbcI
LSQQSIDSDVVRLDGAVTEAGAVRSAVANAVVRLHAEHFGRGPTRARAHITEDFVLVVLEDVLTVAERTLVAAGHGRRVEAARSLLAEAVHQRFVETVEDLTGRTVRAYVSRTSADPELATELFILEPRAED